MDYDITVIAGVIDYNFISIGNNSTATAAVTDYSSKAIAIVIDYKLYYYS